MSAKTDIWMPLYIGDYLAATTHLGAEESGAYLHLLMHQWKNGTLPAESESLRRIARVEKDAWSNAWAMLQPFFDIAEAGFPVQKNLERIRSEWDTKKASAAEKARLAAEARWSKDAWSNAPSIAPSNAQAMPETCPSSSPSPISIQVQKPSRKRVAKKDSDPRHSAFRDLLGKAWAHKNPRLEMPWDASEAAQMASLLQASPSLNEETFKRMLNNWHKSEVNHGERPRVWLSRITDYGNGPIDRFGKPMESPRDAVKPTTLAEKLARIA